MKLVYGFGINDVKEPAHYYDADGCRKHHSWYRKWHEMIRRCHSVKYQLKNPTYIGCTVSDEWKYLSDFKKWYESHVQGNIQDYHLDKDLFIPNNKVYSPDSCVIIPSRLNTLITKRDAKRGQYPIGVYFHSRELKFESRCREYDIVSNKSIKKFLGYHNTPEEASSAYVEYKSQLIESYIPQIDQLSVSDEMKQRIKKGLKVQIQLLQEGSYG